MELRPGTYGFEDLPEKAWFVTRWLTVTAEDIANYGPFAAPGGPSHGVAGLLLLSLVEGAKSSGPVQLAALSVVGWEITPATPVRAGTRLRGRYEIVQRRRMDGNRGIVTLALRIETNTGQVALNGQTQLVMEAGARRSNSL